MSNTILRGRISYAHLFEPHAAMPGQDPKYSVSLIIPKDDEAMLERARKDLEECAAVREEMQEAMELTVKIRAAYEIRAVFALC